MLYRFNLIEGFDIVSGGDGIDLPNNAAARAYAIAAARSIIADDVLCGTLVLSHSIEITAEDGAQLMIMPFADAIAIDRPSTI